MQIIQGTYRTYKAVMFIVDGVVSAKYTRTPLGKTGGRWYSIPAKSLGDFRPNR